MNRAGIWLHGSRSLVSMPGPWGSQAQTGRAIGVVVVLAAAAAAGAVGAINPAVLLVACVATVATVAIPSPAARFAIVVAGGLTVFGNSDQLGVPKFAYLGWVVISTALAIAALAADREHRHLADIRPLLLTSAAVVGAIALSLVVALSTGTPFIDSLRDAAPYGLLAVAPLLAWDGARSRLGPHMEATIVAAGLIASAGFAIQFLGRRGIADLPLATLGLGSGLLGALAFAVAIAALLSRRPRRFLWVLVATAIVTLLLITGTRSALVLLVGPVAMVLAQGQRFSRAIRLASTAVVVGIVVLTLAFLVSQASLIDVVRLTDRLGLLTSLGSNLSADQSYIERATQVGLAYSAFMGSPVVGVGLGFRFDWVHLGGESFPTYTIDTGLSLAAKFGLVGLGLFGIAASAALSFYRRLRIRLPEHVRLSFVGFAAVSIAMLPLGNPLEDKGFGLAVAMLVAWALAATWTTRTKPVRRTAGQRNPVPAASPRVPPE